MFTPIKIKDFSVASPAITENALLIHYEQHYLQYVSNLNKIISGTSLELLPLRSIITQSTEEGNTFNNATQVLNHEMFFEQFTGQSSEEVIMPFLNKYGISSIKELLSKFVDASSRLFGSGYLWLVFNTESKNLQIISSKNSHNFVGKENYIPLICIDLWEHSFYLDYQSHKLTYISEIFRVIDWQVIINRLPNGFLE